VRFRAPLQRGSKIAFVGQNGQGKSTFIKAIVDEFEYGGNIKLRPVQLSLFYLENQAEYLDGEYFVTNYGRRCYRY
jgi:ATP-binding cassette subfamily F protein 3